MYRVREATVDDVGAIHLLAKELLGESVYSYIEMDDTKFKRMTAAAVCGRYGGVFVVVDDGNKPCGFIIGMVDDLFFSKKKYATDLCAYVRPEARAFGAFLVRRFIRWARNIPGVVEVTLGISSGIGDIDRVGRMYERIGFARVGGMYTMRIQ